MRVISFLLLPFLFLLLASPAQGQDEGPESIAEALAEAEAQGESQPGGPTAEGSGEAGSGEGPAEESSSEVPSAEEPSPPHTFESFPKGEATITNAYPLPPRDRPLLPTLLLSGLMLAGLGAVLWGHLSRSGPKMKAS